MIKLKPYHQSPGYCGPASLKMVMDYFGVSAAEKELGILSGTPPVEAPESTTIEGMAKAAKHFGFRVFVKKYSTIQDLTYFTENNIPVIIRWFSGYWGHYSVAVDITEKEIVMVDPEVKNFLIYVKNSKMRLGRFMHLWFDYEGEVIKKTKDVMVRPMMVIIPKGSDFKMSKSIKMVEV